MRFKILTAVGIFFIVLLLLIVGALAFTQTGYFKVILERTVEKVVSDTTGQKLEIGKIEGNFIGGIRVKDVSLKVEGETFIYLKELLVDYSLPRMLNTSVLFSKVVPIDKASFTGFSLNLIQYEDGSWNFNKLGGEKKEKQEDKQEKDKGPPNWDILIQHLLLNEAKVTLENRNKGEVTKVHIPEFNSSLKLFDITRRVVFDLNKADIFVSPNNINIKGLSTNAVYAETEAQINNLEAGVNGAKIRFSGEVKDFKKPRFQFQAAAYGFKFEKGILSAEIEGRGQYISPENIQALVEVNIPDSRIMGKNLSGSIDKIEMAGTEVEIRDGVITSDFGKVLLGGNADLERLLAKEGENRFGLNLALQNIDVTAVLDLLQNKIKDRPNIPNAILDAEFDIDGSWRETEDITVKVDIKEFHQEGKAGDIDLEGVVEATKSNVEFDLGSTLNKVNIGLILNEEKYTSNLNSNLNIEGSLPLNGDLLNNLTARVDGEISPSTLSGIDINGGKINASYSEETLSVESFSLDSDKFMLKAQGTREKEKGVDVTFDADVKNLDFISEFLPELDLSGSLDAEGRVQGNIKNPLVSLAAEISDFTYEDIIQFESANLNGKSAINPENLQLQLDGELTGVTLRDRNIERVNLRARSLGKGITGNISIVEAPQRNYRLELELADITSQEKRLEIEQAIFNLEEIRLQNRRPINVTIHPNRVVVDSLNLYQDSSSILANADVSFEGRVNADLDINNLNLISISRILGFDPPIRGIILGDASLKGTMQDPEIKANIRAQNLELNQFQSDQTSLNLSYLNKELDIDLGVSQNAVQILQVDGEAEVDLNLKKIGENLKYATFNLTVSSNGFELSPIAEITEKDISGVVTGNVVFQGTLENPRIKTNLNTQNLGFRELTTDKTELNLSYLNRKLDVNLNMTESGREILMVNGAANIDLNLLRMGENVENASFDLAIKSSGLELSPFAKLSEEITKLDGKVLIDLRASGSFNAPQLNGQIRPQDVLVKTKSPENEIKVADGLIEMQGQRVFLRTLELRTDDDGVGRFQGEADLGIPSYSLKGKMEDFQLKLKQISTKLDGNLDASGSDEKVKVTGRFEAERARIIIPEETTKEVKEIKFVDERDQQKKEEFVIEDTEESDYFTENVALDLRVSIPHNAWVRGRGANIELEGDMNVLKQYGEPLVLTGSINTVRGSYEILGKLFKIEQGTVSFQGIPEINPLLDVTALYEVSDVDIFVNIGGTARQPEVKLTSEPTMEETDIFSYLVFGTSSDKIGAGERVSLEARAAQVLGNLAAGQLKGIIGEELSLDVIQVKAGAEGPELEVGKYLTDDLYIAYERGPSELITISTPTVTNRVKVEYRLFDFLTLQSDVGGEQAGGDVFFQFDY